MEDTSNSTAGKVTAGKSNNWFATLNNPEGDPEEVLKLMHQEGKATYTVGQLEKGTTGTPHL